MTSRTHLPLQWCWISSHSRKERDVTVKHVLGALTLFAFGSGTTGDSEQGNYYISAIDDRFERITTQVIERVTKNLARRGQLGLERRRSTRSRDLAAEGVAAAHELKPMNGDAQLGAKSR